MRGYWQTHRLLLLAVLLVAVATSCTQECNSSNCGDGCCSSEGECKVGGGDTACGLGGSACVDCGSSAACDDKGAACVLRLGQSCEDGTQCISGLCLKGQCTGCTAGLNQCFSKAECCGLRCVPKPGEELSGKYYCLN